MLVLEWRLTLLTLVVLPLFIIPAKRVGRALQRISREQMDINAEMNTQMTERFNVSGALLVKLFGRYERRGRRRSPTRAGQVRDIGIRRAMYGRVFFVALGLVSAIGSGRRLRRRRPPGDRRRHRDRHARRDGGLRHPALRAANEPHQRPGRPDDRRW